MPHPPAISTMRTGCRRSQAIAAVDGTAPPDHAAVIGRSTFAVARMLRTWRCVGAARTTHRRGGCGWRIVKGQIAMRAQYLAMIDGLQTENSAYPAHKALPKATSWAMTGVNGST